jgi:outer membrane receptor for ferrienterochelin and colicins
VQNIFNAYQADFDIGKNRDSNYIYGPARPRGVFVGVKIEAVED